MEDEQKRQGWIKEDEGEEEGLKDVLVQHQMVGTQVWPHFSSRLLSFFLSFIPPLFFPSFFLSFIFLYCLFSISLSASCPFLSFFSHNILFFFSCLSPSLSHLLCLSLSPSPFPLASLFSLSPLPFLFTSLFFSHSASLRYVLSISTISTLGFSSRYSLSFLIHHTLPFSFHLPLTMCHSSSPVLLSF